MSLFAYPLYIPIHLWCVNISEWARVTRRCVSDYSHMTLPFMASSSFSSPTGGTGTPQVKSLVTAVGRNPPFILGSTISPLARMTALLAHLPFSRVSCKNFSSRGCKASRRKQEWVDGLVVTLWFLLRLHRGCKSSVGDEKVPAH